MSELKVPETEINYEKCLAIVVDVAGTATSLKYIKEELFKYTTDKVEDFLKANWDDENVKKAIKLMNPDEDVEATKAIELFKKLVEEQSQNEGLKILQGLIYKQGYEDGTLKGHVYPDVAECFPTWAKNKKIGIYSTGSVESQKLLFSNSTEGDLTKHINKYFDQSIGGKNETKGYIHIAKEFEMDTENIAFITDTVEEAKAAKECGVMAILIKREGNDEIPEDQLKDFMVINSFKDLTFENPSKRKCVEHPEVPPQKIVKPNEDEKPENTETTETKVEEKMDVEHGKTDDDAVTKETAQNETETTTTTNKEKTDVETAVEEKMEIDDASSENPSVEEKVAENVTETEKDKVEEKKDKENGEIATKKEDEDNKEQNKDEKKEAIDNTKEKLEAINDKIVENKDEPVKENAEIVVDNTDEKSLDKKETELDKKNEKENSEEKTESNSQKVPDALNGEKNDEEVATTTEHKETNGVLANGVEKDKKEENGVEQTEKEKGDGDKPSDDKIKVKKITESTETTTSENETLNG